MIRMILGWTMIGLGCNYSSHLIREIIVPDDMLLPRMIKDDVRVKVKVL